MIELSPDLEVMRPEAEAILEFLEGCEDKTLFGDVSDEHFDRWACKRDTVLGPRAIGRAPSGRIWHVGVGNPSWKIYIVVLHELVKIGKVYQREEHGDRFFYGIVGIEHAKAQ